MDVLCIALCTLVDTWITTGADSDTARFWRKYAHKDSEKCIQQKEILIWDPNIILLSNDLLFIPVKTNIDLHYILRPSPYRTVNTLRLGYKNQSVNAV